MNAIGFGLQSLVQLLKSQKIPYVVIGGIAVSLYGHPRFTADIDVNILLNKDRINTFLKACTRHGFAVHIVDKKNRIVELEFMKNKLSARFDIIIAENVLEYAAIKRGKVRTINGVRVKVVSAEDLILHKIASSRARDREDLIGILARQKNTLDVHYIEQWLARFDKLDGNKKYTMLFKRVLAAAIPREHFPLF